MVLDKNLNPFTSYEVGGEVNSKIPQGYAPETNVYRVGSSGFVVFTLQEEPQALAYSYKTSTGTDGQLTGVVQFFGTHELGIEPALLEPLPVTVSRFEDGTWEFSCRPLKVIVSGRTPQEAKNELIELIQADLAEYPSRPESQLSPAAQKVREAYKYFFGV